MKLAVASLSVLAACAARPRHLGAQAAPVSAALAPGEHNAVLTGVRFYYRVGGSGSAGAPPVVFLHGGPGQGSEHFEALAGSYMERNLRMVWYDQRGSGFSERPVNRDYALTTMVDDIEALRRELGTPKIALIGHSFGAVLALPRMAPDGTTATSSCARATAWATTAASLISRRSSSIRHWRRDWTASTPPAMWYTAGRSIVRSWRPA